MSILRKLARWPDRNNIPDTRYQDDRQISLIKVDGQWVESWNVASLAGTKKYDIETGEDSKGQ